MGVSSRLLFFLPIVRDERKNVTRRNVVPPNPKPSTLNPKPQTLNPKSYTLNLKP